MITGIFFYFHLIYIHELFHIVLNPIKIYKMVAKPFREWLSLLFCTITENSIKPVVEHHCFVYLGLPVLGVLAMAPGAG